ncbi:MAG: ABC transporter permease [Planctomycetota bacterium]
MRDAAEASNAAVDAAPVKAAERAERRGHGFQRGLAPFAAPLGVGLVVAGVWEFAVGYWQVPEYLLPPPSAIVETMGAERATLASAWCVTFGAMAVALMAAVLFGVLLAAVFATSRIVELSLFPYAVVLQVTPLVAIAPLLMIWINTPWIVKLVCAWIVAFFPILSNTALGLRAADPGLSDLFRLYRASPWQRARLLLAPSALPYFLAGLRVAVNLALVGAVVAEFVTGAATDHPGLASLVFEGQYAMNVPLTFAALGLISGTGIAMYFATHLLSRWLLGGWHASSLEPDRP